MYLPVFSFFVLRMGSKRKADHTPEQWRAHLDQVNAKRKIKKANGTFKKPGPLTPEQRTKKRDKNREWMRNKCAVDPDFRAKQQQRSTDHNRVSIRTKHARRLRKYQRGAKDRELEWALPDEEAIALFDRPCAYCGVTPIETGILSGIDRVDNACGYVCGNCVPCCEMCNRMKHKNDKEVFIAQATRIAAHQLFRQAQLNPV